LNARFLKEVFLATVLKLVSDKAQISFEEIVAQKVANNPLTMLIPESDYPKVALLFVERWHLNRHHDFSLQ